MELRDESLLLGRERSTLDEAVFSFTEVLADCGIEYVIVSGYVAILTGRSRSTEDIVIIVERLDEKETGRLTSELQNRGYWGMSTPFESLHEMLQGGDRVRIAEEDEIFPNFELWFVSNDVEREALRNSITACFDERGIEISPIELQIAFKLRLAQQMDSKEGKDFEDALHLYLTFEEEFKKEQLERYVKELNVEDYYAELKRI